MVNRRRYSLFKPVLTVFLTLCVASVAEAEQAGSIRGRVTDADFDDAPVPGVTVRIAETEQEVTTGEQGNYAFPDLEPGAYTLVFSKGGYTRNVESNVVVTAGQLTDVDVAMTGDFAELEEFVVRELQLAAGSEAALIDLRFDATQVLDSIGSDFLSRAGASDAAAGLRLVAGATTTAEGFAAVRGLPPRFVSTQLNGFSLPSADPDTRAVQLDLFPSEVIESIQVSKTFTPDQMGDASGGAVNIVTKSIPDENFIKFSSKVEVNTQRPGSGEFLQDARGDVPFFGSDSSRDLVGGLSGLSNNTQIPSQFDNPDTFDRDLPPIQFGSPSPRFSDAPIQYEWGVTGGLRHEFDTGVKIGGVATMFWDQDISHDDERINDERELILGRGVDDLVPGIDDDINDGFLNNNTASLIGAQVLTALFDETQSQQEITWGGLATLGLEAEGHQLDVTFMRTQITTSTVTIAEDTRGKFEKFPGHDPTQITTPGGADDPNVGGDTRDFAPFRRLETQEFVKRTVQSLQFNGEHTLPFFSDGLGWDGALTFDAPVFDWHYADSRSEREEPGTTRFDSKFLSADDQFIPFVTGLQRKVSFDNANLGPVNTIFRDIEEDSTQYRLNLTLPFEQWSGEQGAVKLGQFDDQTTRKFIQNTFFIPTNAINLRLFEPFDDARLSDAFANPEKFPLASDDSTPPDLSGETGSRGGFRPPQSDFELDGQQDIEAWYVMVDLPLTSFLSVIGGARFESTRLNTELKPDNPEDTTLFIDNQILDAKGLDPGLQSLGLLETNDIPINSSIDREDVLPSLGFVLTPLEGMKIRGTYSQTLARPTFRELTPNTQVLFPGATPFAGNPSLEVSEVENWDIRVDYRPEPGSLLSLSYFKKNLTNPIQTIQQTQKATTLIIPVNFPDGTIEGWEFEARQDMGRFFQSLRGLTLGGNLTLLDTEVSLRDFELDGPTQGNLVGLRGAGFKQSSIDMVNAPEFLANLFLTYDLEETGTQASLFYTLRGDTLVSGPSTDAVTVDAAGNPTAGVFFPSIYETQFGTLNFTLSQKLGKHINLKFSAKNLTNPDVETVYRSDLVPGGDVVKTRSSSGIDFSVSLSGTFEF